jgi:uncharacterized membrane protein
MQRGTFDMFEPSRLMKATPFTRNILARPRLLLCTASTLLVFLIEPVQYHLSTRLLIAWNLGTWLYIVLSLIMMSGATEQSIRHHALLGDESRFVILTLASVAAAASLAAIVAQVAAVKDAVGLLKYAHLALAGSTIVSAWTFVHLIFAQHYAHEFYIERDDEQSLPEEFAGGLRFPGTVQPIFIDFLYFSFVIGVASQTADVETTSHPMRRVTLVHCILAFFFNTIILALTINIAAGLI